MHYPYQCILLVGATSGIGYALASKLAEDGKHVIVVGRRKEKLDELQQKYGKDKVSTIQFDITDLAGMKGFVDRALKEHPDIDNVIMNSGIQRSLDFTKPESIDFGGIDAEITTNYTSCIHILKYILPHLTKIAETKPAGIMFTTSGLALTPIPRCGNYCATKAALHHLILVLRSQLSSTPNLKIIELFPPAVQTELHDAKHQPDIVNGGSIGMPLDEFMEKTWKGLCEGDEQILVGISETSFKGWEVKRQEEFEERLRMIREGTFK